MNKIEERFYGYLLNELGAPSRLDHLLIVLMVLLAVALMALLVGVLMVLLMGVLLGLSRVWTDRSTCP